MPALSTLTTTQTVTLSVLNINQTVTPFALITATGGTTPLLYSITPGIFTGLNFSTSTGIITGTPTTLTDDITYQITVSDSGGGLDLQTASYLFRLAVVNRLLTSLDIANSKLTASIPTAPIVPVTVTGGYKTKTWSISPNLPEGLKFNSVTGSISNASRLATTATQYLITAQDQANFRSTGTFTLTILPFKGLDVPQPWETTGTIGTLVPGEISELYVKGQFSTSTIYTTYKISSGTLPNGLTLNRDGTISGRANIINTTLNNATSTSSFTVAITDSNNNHLRSNNFSITVKQTLSTQYTEIYCKPFLIQSKRSDFTEFIKNEKIFIPSMLYRPLDPNFGKQEEIKLVIDFGVKRETLATYVDIMSINFYKRKIEFGKLKTAVARNADGTIRHEIIYVDIIDKHVNSSKISVPREIIFNGTTYYPPSMLNMRARLESITNLTIIRNPKFTSTVQTGDSIVSGYIPFVPLCFTLPNKSATIIRKINESNFKFNTFNFEIDRVIVQDALNQTGAKYLLLNRNSKLA